MTLPNGWKSVRLNEIAEKCTEKNRDFNYSLVLTNSAQRGIIPQTEHFGKDIAVDENIDGYLIVNDGEFVYNPRISVTAPCGPIRRNHLGKTGVMSPLYTVFKLKNDTIDNTYIEYYFMSSEWYRYMKSIANYGARHDRMSIADDSFFEMPILLPPFPEQHAIAEILSTADKLIAVKERLIAAKQKQKRWLMQNLLMGNMRLPGFSGEWEKTYFEELFTERSFFTNNIENNPLYSLTIENGVIAKTERYERSHLILKDEAYKIVYPNDYVYNPMNVRFGALARYKGIISVSVSGYYNVFKCNNEADCGFFDSYLTSPYMITYYNKVSAGSLVEKQRVHFSQFINFRLPLPSSDERLAIAKILTTADREIELLSKDLEQQKQIKKYLMQQLLTGKRRIYK